MTWRIRHVDLKQGLPTLRDAGDPLYVIFWWGDVPVGAQAFVPEELTLRHDQLLTLAAMLLARQVASRCQAFGGPPPARVDGRAMITPPLARLRDIELSAAQLSELDLPFEGDADDLAVVVCTRDRPAALRACLSALVAQRALPGEILVVDNSASGTAASVCKDYGVVRYLHEPQPGLSRARNRGIAECARPLVAFTDDDVEVHEHWSAEIGRALRHTDAEAVTGLVVPAALETEAQRFFQFEMGAFGASYVPTHFDQVFFRQTCYRGTQVWRIGAGANMAFRRELFDRIGGFDERLGAGAAGCSEDSELWYRVLANGGTCLYEPRAVVFHHHREDWSVLRRQMRFYMRGHVAALIVQYDRHGHAGNLHRTFRQLPHHFMRVAIDAVRHGKPQRRRLLLEEVRGWFGGLLYFANPRWRSRRPAALVRSPRRPG